MIRETCARVTPGQVRMLQVLWNLYIDAGDTDARMHWASRNVGRTITSFTELTSEEAGSLADVLQRGLMEVSR
jgi:hypothetical protein